MSSWRLAALPAALTLLVAAGCLAIAGLDGDYVEGVPQGGGPTSGSAQGGAASSTTPSAGATTSQGPGGASGSGGEGASGGTGMAGMGGMGPTWQVLCARGQLCDPGEVCCTHIATNDKLGCAASEEACADRTFGISCDETADCASGEICCGVWAVTHWTQIRCESSCNGSNDRVICGGPTPPPGYCSGSCIQSSSLSGYYWCDP
jgi:hypothetical protein